MSVAVYDVYILQYTTSEVSGRGQFMLRYLRLETSQGEVSSDVVQLFGPVYTKGTVVGD